MKKLMHLFMFATIFFTLAACGSGGDSSSTAGKTTVLVYMEGTTLETEDVSASKNIGEMLAANYSPDTTVALATGAANKGSSGWVSSWKTVKYHVVRNKELVEVSDLGNVDMGTPAQLTKFIEWGQKTYPADRYILVFWDHGGGTLGGFGGYSTAKPPGDFPTTSGLTVAQLRDVVKANVAKTGKKFELIGFDACLMGTLEIANSFTGSANYLVASQDIEAGAGWDWTAMVNFVVGNPNADGGKIGTAIAKSFYAKLERAGEGENKTATMSVINLEKIKPLNEALAAFSVWQQKLLTDDGIDAWYNLAYSRSKTMDFYTSDLDLSGSGDTVDILDLSDNIQTMSQGNITTDDGLMFEQLEKAVRSAVVYNQVGTERTSASGLSMMFPTYTVWSNGDGGASFNNLAVYKDIAPDPLYSALIADYSKRARTIIAPITIGNPVVNGSAITAIISNMNLYYWYEMAYIAMISTETKDGKENNYYSGHQPIWPKTNSTTLSYVWDDKKWMTLSGKIVSVMADPVLPNPSKPSVLRLRIPLQYKESTGLYYLDYDFATNKVEQHLGFLADLGKQASRGFAKLERGMKVTALQSLRVANDQFPFNNWVAENENDAFTLDWSDEQGGPTFEQTALPAGTYNLAFTLYDLTMRPSYSATTISKTIVAPPAE